MSSFGFLYSIFVNVLLISVFKQLAGDFNLVFFLMYLPTATLSYITLYHISKR